MSAAPPAVIPRKPSGVRVMITPGQQPPYGGMPVYTDGKSKRIWLLCEHVGYNSTVGINTVFLSVQGVEPAGRIMHLY